MAHLVVQYGKTPLFFLNGICESSVEMLLVKSSNLGENVYLSTDLRGLFLSVYADDIKLQARQKTQNRLGKFLWKTLTLENQHHFLTMGIGVAFKVSVKSAKILWRTMELCSIPGFQLEPQKLPTRASGKPDAETISSWSCDIEGYAKKCVKRYGELENKTTQQLYKVATPCMDDHQFKEEEIESVQTLSTVCSQIILKCLYLARIGRPDMLWSVNKLARAVTKWTKACDKRLARLISYTHHTSEYRQCVYVGNTAQQCRLGLFQDSAFAGDREDSESRSGGVLCIFGSRIFVPICWMCKKQTSDSHSSAEAEVISLDAGLRKDGIPALDLWNLVKEVFHSIPNRIDGPKREPRGNPSAIVKPNMHITIPIKHTNVIPTNIDHIPSHTKKSDSSYGVCL